MKRCPRMSNEGCHELLRKVECKPTYEAPYLVGLIICVIILILTII